MNKMNKFILVATIAVSWLLAGAIYFNACYPWEACFYRNLFL